MFRELFIDKEQMRYSFCSLFFTVVAGFLFFSMEERTKERQPEIETEGIEPITEHSSSNSITWANVTPEYFLDETVFKSTGTSVLRELKRNTSEAGQTFIMRWHDESNHLFMTATTRKHEDGFHVLEKAPLGTRKTGNATVTYLGNFSFNGEIIDEFRLDTKPDNKTVSVFCLKWSEDRFCFSIRTTLSEYRNEKREIAENIIKRYTQ